MTYFTFFIFLLPNYTHSCRPVGWQVYVSYIAPFALIYAFNFFMFFFIIISLIRKQKKLSVETGNASLGMKTKAQVVLAVSLSLLFGIGWASGVPATQSFDVLWLRFLFELVFVVLTAFQGLFVFIMYGIRVRNVRLTWMKWFYIAIRDKNKALSISYGLGSDGVPTKRSKPIQSASNVYTLGTFDTGMTDVNLASYTHATSAFNLSSSSHSPVPTPESCVCPSPTPYKSDATPSVNLPTSVESHQRSFPKSRTRKLTIVPSSRSQPHVIIINQDSPSSLSEVSEDQHSPSSLSEVSEDQHTDSCSDKNEMLSKDLENGKSTVSSEADGSEDFVLINQNTD